MEKQIMLKLKNLCIKKLTIAEAMRKTYSLNYVLPCFTTTEKQHTAQKLERYASNFERC